MNKDGTNNASSFKRGNNWIGSPFFHPAQLTPTSSITLQHIQVSIYSRHKRKYQKMFYKCSPYDSHSVFFIERMMEEKDFPY